MWPTLAILLPQPLESWDYRCQPPHPVWCAFLKVVLPFFKSGFFHFCFKVVIPFNAVILSLEVCLILNTEKAI
jgi:hypothetical protein